ncbi:hypothetical protein [Candidatus Amarobacter glycogenicus]|uniref:hypothetical protein n=1 Tax=Candidatus Amarobacter glycogenicus TaxID=3140699 RepID=UPI0031CC66D2
MGTLSYGLQKRVELGRAWPVEPTILLLDGPMAGMNIEEKRTWPASSSTSTRSGHHHHPDRARHGRGDGH